MDIQLFAVMSKEDQDLWDKISTKGKGTMLNYARNNRFKDKKSTGPGSRTANEHETEEAGGSPDGDEDPQEENSSREVTFHHFEKNAHDVTKNSKDMSGDILVHDISKQKDSVSDGVSPNERSDSKVEPPVNLFDMLANPKSERELNKSELEKLRLKPKNAIEMNVHARDDNRSNGKGPNSYTTGFGREVNVSQREPTDRKPRTSSKFDTSQNRRSTMKNPRSGNRHGQYSNVQGDDESGHQGRNRTQVQENRVVTSTRRASVYNPRPIDNVGSPAMRLPQTTRPRTSQPHGKRSQVLHVDINQEDRPNARPTTNRYNLGTPTDLPAMRTIDKTSQQTFFSSPQEIEQGSQSDEFDYQEDEMEGDDFRPLTVEDTIDYFDHHPVDYDEQVAPRPRKPDHAAGPDPIVPENQPTDLDPFNINQAVHDKREQRGTHYPRGYDPRAHRPQSVSATRGASRYEGMTLMKGLGARRQQQMTKQVVPQNSFDTPSTQNKKPSVDTEQVKPVAPQYPEHIKPDTLWMSHICMDGEPRPCAVRHTWISWRLDGRL